MEWRNNMIWRYRREDSPLELEQRRRRQQIARRRASINEQMLLLDQIQEAINALDELRRDITVRPRII